MSRKKNKQLGFTQHLAPRLVRRCRTFVYPKEKDSELGAGFTIIELMIATMIFSLVLLVFLASFLQISRLFYKSVNISRTQEVARTILADISDDIRFSQGAPTQPAGNYFCVGLHRYKISPGNQVGGNNPITWDLVNNYGLVREIVSSGCPDPATPGSSPQELLSNGMALNKLAVGCASGVCTIDINVVFYGVDNTVLASSDPSNTEPWKAPDAKCTGALGGSQYCATATYKSTVLQNF